MELEEIRNKYQCDEGRTFAQWKEWVRKNKPSQAETHIVTAVAPNGSKYERLIGGYTDAQNTAFDLVAHGYKNVKMFKSVNAGPLKLLRNFSAPLHGAKFKDGADSVEEIREKYTKDVYSPILGKEFSGKGKDFDKALRDKRYEGLYKQIDFYLKHYAKQKKLSDVQMKDLKRLVNEIRSYGKNGERWVTEVKKTVKEFKDSYEDIENIRNKYQKDAAFGVKVKGNEKGSERLTMEKVFKELSPAPAWKKVKKGNTIVIRTNINGKDQDVVTIKYFNPNIVAMTPRGGAANMVALKDVTVMCSKLGVEGRRSYNDSADGVERIRAKYSTDAYDLGISKKEIDPKAPLKVLSVTTKKEPDGISGSVSFTKGNKKVSERFMVYNSGNWDKKPFGSSAYGYSASDREALMNAVRNKLSTMGIKAK